MEAYGEYQKMVSGKQMCELIVKALKLDYPELDLTPVEIWELSPTGELWPIVALYEWAKNHLSEGSEK